MNLGDFAAIVQTWENNDYVFTSAFDSVHVYGDGCDVIPSDEIAFAPAVDVSVAKIKGLVESALNDFFCNRLSDFKQKFNANTPCNLAFEGEVSFYGEHQVSFHKLVTEMVAEYNLYSSLNLAKLASKRVKVVRLTKEQRLEREAEAKAKLEAERAAVYLAQLMSTLEKATKLNFTLTVNNGKFIVSHPDWDTDRWPGAVYSTESYQELCEVELRISIIEREIAEQTRIANIRKEALGKLSTEERQVLGLVNNF